MEVTVQLDPQQMAAIDRKCSLFMEQSKIDTAINRAAKRAADSAKAETKKQITERYTLPAGQIGKTISTAGNKGSGVGASMIISDSPNALPKFSGTKPNKPQPKSRPVQQVNVKTETGAKSVPGWFTAQMKSGHIGVFSRRNTTRMKSPYQRTGKDKWGRNPAKTGRAQLTQKHGPPAPKMFERPEIVEPVKKYAEEVLSKRLDHEFERLLGDA